MRLGGTRFQGPGMEQQRGWDSNGPPNPTVPRFSEDRNQTPSACRAIVLSQGPPSRSWVGARGGSQGLVQDIVLSEEDGKQKEIRNKHSERQTLSSRCRGRQESKRARADSGPHPAAAGPPAGRCGQGPCLRPHLFSIDSQSPSSFSS